jgi:hypothetical protein
MDAFFLRGRSCPEDELTDTSDTAALNVHHLSGLFIITYVRPHTPWDLDARTHNHPHTP